MSEQRSRREFLRNAALTSAGLWAVDSSAAWAKANRSANEKVQFACIGVGGQGQGDTANAARVGTVVAICDVDDNELDRAAQRYPNAKKYNDYRKMLDEMHKDIDAVTIAIPDHSHGPAAAMAMHMGKACYCEKPLAHSIHEVRVLSELARKMKVASQMGNMGTSYNSMRQNAYNVRAGAIGVVREVHVWTNRPIWPQGLKRSEAKTPPSNLHWDLWLGPAKERPFGDHYHRFDWRGWWDFGTGALGDMACHTVNLPFMALDLRNPTSVLAEVVQANNPSDPNAGYHDSYPITSKIRYEFPANAVRPAVTMYWYDGPDDMKDRKRPPADLFTGGKLDDLVVEGRLPNSGSLIIGDKGKLYTPGDYGDGGHFSMDVPNSAFPSSPGHWEEFVNAVKSSDPLDPKNRAMANFPDYAGPLAETILLGNLAVWTPEKKVEWDAKRLKAKNLPESEMIVRPTYRKGYSL